jgi:hypothetical protein
MPGDTKHDRWLVKARMVMIVSVGAVVAAVYVFRYFFGS